MSSASEKLAELQLKKLRRDEGSKKAGAGIALLLVAGFIGLAIWGANTHKPTTTNSISAYARSLGMMLQLDAAAAREIASAANDRNFPRAYSAAARTINVLGPMKDEIVSDAPGGFARTETAADAYLDEMRQRYSAEAKLADDPRPATIEEFREAWSATYLKALVDAFTSDLSHTPLTKAEKARVMKRFLGQRL